VNVDSTVHNDLEATIGGSQIKVGMCHSTWKMDRLLTVTILMPLTSGFNLQVMLKLKPTGIVKK